MSPAPAGGASPERPLAVVDIDGVVADVRHRLHHLEQRPKRWDAFFEAASEDPVLAEGAEAVQELSREHDLVWLTGRPERNRALTEAWLRRSGLPEAPLVMRPDKDHRPARLHKREQVRRLGRTRHVGLVLDDDPIVVDLLREDGWPVHLAEWLPHSSTLNRAQERDGRT